MAIAIDTRKIDEWFQMVDGWKIVQPKDDEPSTPESMPTVTIDQVKDMAQSCDWIDLDNSFEDTLYVRQGFLYPITLELGWGHPDEQNFIMFNAYRV